MTESGLGNYKHVMKIEKVLHWGKPGHTNSRNDYTGLTCDSYTSGTDRRTQLRKHKVWWGYEKHNPASHDGTRTGSWLEIHHNWCSSQNTKTKQRTQDQRRQQQNTGNNRNQGVGFLETSLTTYKTLADKQHSTIDLQKDEKSHKMPYQTLQILTTRTHGVNNM